MFLALSLKPIYEFCNPLLLFLTLHFYHLQPNLGRFDTPNHELYSTLMSEHKEDFYNCFIKQPHANEGPREPWHDIHSKVEGPIAHDVFTNFYERWRKQCKREVRLEPLDRNIFDLDCIPPFTGNQASLIL